MPISATVRAQPLSSTQRTARRCLFERTADTETNDAFVKRLLDEIHDTYRLKWEFDFDADEPLNNGGNFVYERMNASQVPGFYRASNYSPVLPSSLMDKENYDNKCASGKYFDDSSYTSELKYSNTLKGEDLDAENVNPAKQTSRPWSKRYAAALNGSYDDIEFSFEEEEEDDDEPLLNDSTSSSDGSNANESCAKSATNITTTITKVGVTATVEQRRGDQNCSPIIMDKSLTNLSAVSDEGTDSESEESLLLSSTKRRTAAVTPKKRGIRDYMLSRKSLELSCAKRRASMPSISYAKEDHAYGFCGTPLSRHILTARRKRLASPHEEKPTYKRANCAASFTLDVSTNIGATAANEKIIKRRKIIEHDRFAQNE